jgi:hypothetical protein
MSRSYLEKSESYDVGKLYVTKSVFLSEVRLLWRLSASVSFLLYLFVFVNSNMLSATSMAFRFLNLH